MYSDLVRKALEEAGWYPGRKIDIKPYIEALKAEGYDEVPQVLKDFLTEFGGLHLKERPFTDWSDIVKDNPELKKYREPPDRIMHFDVLESQGTGPVVPISKEEIFEPRVGEDLIPFGEIYDGRYLLAMTPTGKIYAIDGTSILYLGKDYIEMLENDYHRVRPVEVP